MSNPELDLQIDRPSESVPEMVVRRVRDAIASGALPPGRRLTERELMDLTGVSRASIREAVRHLQTLGLVETSPTRGVRVAVLGMKEVREIYEVRDALEPAAAELFVRRATDGEVEAILATIDELVSVGKPAPKTSYEFDMQLIEGARNSLLASTLAPLHARIHALRKLSMSTPNRWPASMQEYLDLGAAIRERSPERAAEASRRHVRAAAAAALEAMQKLEGEAGSP